MFIDYEVVAKVGYNNFVEIYLRFAVDFSVLKEKKCSLNNVYRLVGMVRSIIKDFFGIIELNIVNEMIY